MRLHRTVYRPLRCAVCGAAGLLALLHPVLHGTVFDGGLLDALLPQLQMWASSMSAVDA